MTRHMLGRVSRVACAALLFGAPCASAAIHPAGDEFVVSYDDGDKVEAALDGLSRLVVVWRTRSAFDSRSILMRRYGPTGEPLGPIEVVYGARPDTAAEDLHVACGLDGSCALPYAERIYLDQPAPSPPDMSIWQPWLAIYDALGQCVRNEREPAFGEAAAEAGGAFAVVYRSPAYPQPDPIAVRLYDPSGEPLGEPLHLSAGYGDASAAHLAADSSGRYIVFWTERAQDDYLWHLAQRLTPLGQPAGPIFEIGAHDAVCSDAAGRLVTVVSAVDVSGQKRVLASRFDLNGTRSWGPTPISGPATALARVACDAAGGFVAAWRGTSADGLHTYVAARRYTAGNRPDGPELQVNQTEASPLEIALASDPRGNFTVLWRSSGIRARRFTLERPAVRKGDVDGDDQTDLVLARPADGKVRVWNMSEGQRLANTPLYPDSPAPEWSVAGVDDFDGDGHNDLLLRRTDDGALWQWMLGGAGGVECQGGLPLAGSAPISTQWELAATGDFTLDGWPEIVWQERDTGRLLVWITTNAAYAGVRAPMPDAPLDPNWRVVAAQDFDGDGKRDLLWFNTTSGRLVQWLLDAGLRRQAGRFTNPPAVSDASWQAVAAGDYGVGPGGQADTSDVVWRNSFSGRLVIWFLDRAGNRTAGTFTNPAAPSDPLAWTVVGPR